MGYRRGAKQSRDVERYRELINNTGVSACKGEIFYRQMQRNWDKEIMKCTTHAWDNNLSNQGYAALVVV